MCFSPQRRAFFRHLNFQKCPGNGVFCTVWLQHVLRATTACNCLSLISPDGSPTALASLLFDPPEPQIIWKTQCFATLLPFRAPASSFFWLFLCSDLLSADSFSSLTLRTSSFPSVHVVGSLTSKLPSIRCESESSCFLSHLQAMLLLSLAASSRTSEFCQWFSETLQPCRR